MDRPTVIIPATDANDVPVTLDRTRLQDGALAQRMEMLEVELQIAQDTATVRVSRNQMLPVLAFNYVYGRNGAGQTLGHSFDQVWSRDFDMHTVGLQLQIPIGNEAARSQLRRALLSRLQQLATREQRAAQVRQDVLNAVDNVETDWQRILASRKRVELASRTLDVEVHQFEAGFRTSTDVIDAQARLADAQSSEVSSVTDYQIAQVDLGVATGTTLGASRLD
jgi:outer membrane protein TolC